MPLVRNDSSLSAFWNLDSLTLFLKQAMTQAGMSAVPYDEFDIGGERCLVWEKVTDPAKTYGKFYYALQFTTTDIRQGVFAAYDRDSDSFPSGSQWSSFSSLSVSFLYRAIALRSDEANIVVFRADNARMPVFLGWVRPASRPVFWDENSTPYVFVQNLGSPDEWQSTERSPYRFDNGEFVEVGRFKLNFQDPFPANPNPVNGAIDVLTGIYLYAQFSLGQGIVGAFSADWGRATDRVSLAGQLIATSNGHQYAIVSPSPDVGIGAGVVRTV